MSSIELLNDIKGGFKLLNDYNLFSVIIKRYARWFQLLNDYIEIVLIVSYLAIKEHKF